MQVLRSAASGQTAKVTAFALHLSTSAVSLYMLNARRKLGAKTKSEAIVMLMNTGADLNESIECAMSRMRDNDSTKTDQLHEMQLISSQMRRLVEGMVLADATNVVQNTDLTAGVEMTVKLLRTAAHALGYEIVRMRVA
jgi:hypothetical protein